MAGRVLTTLDADPVAAATLSVVRGNETPIDVERLEIAYTHGDEMAAKALAVRARRLGNVEETSERYGGLLDGQAADPAVLKTLGNLAFEAGEIDKAIELYERAAAIENSATLMFNLSQVYAKAFRMEELENALQLAQSMDAELVARLSKRGDTNFAADLPFDIEPIRARMFEAARGEAHSRVVSGILAPGWLGSAWMHLAGGFMLAAIGSVFIGRMYQHASICGRCGRRICARCDDSMWSSDLCDGCHHLFHRPQGTDPNLRMARLKALRAREMRVEKLGAMASLVIPGCGGPASATAGSQLSRHLALRLRDRALRLATRRGARSPCSRSSRTVGLRHGGLCDGRSLRRCDRLRAHDPAEHVRMSVALHGNLKDFGIAEVFQLIGQQCKTGLLEISGDTQKVQLAFDEGRVVWASPVGNSEFAVLG